MTALLKVLACSLNAFVSIDLRNISSEDKPDEYLVDEVALL
jgi:hypothetical protein